MKQKIMIRALLLLSATALTACPPKSSDNNNNLAAQQGRVMSQDATSFCDLNAGTLTCVGVDQNGMQCRTLAKSYNPNDTLNLCVQLQSLRSETNMNTNFGFNMNQCNVDGAISQALATHCQGVGGQNGQNFPGDNNPMNPNQPNPQNPQSPGGDLGMSIKSFQCDFEAQRTGGRSWFNSNVSIPKTTALITLDGRVSQRVDLRTKFLGLDIGKFGKISMLYKPSRGNSVDDSIELRNEGLKIGDESVRITQIGSAGQEVKMEALTDGLFMKISCRPSSQVRSGNGNNASAISGGQNLACSGKSFTIGSDHEEIDLVIPLSTLSNGQEVQISQSVTAKLNGSSLTYNAVLDKDYGPTIISTVSLRSASTLKASDRVADINVTCGIQ